MTSYRSAVREARAIVRRTEADQWRLAELTWEQVTQHGYSPTSWAQDTGLSANHARRLVHLWERNRDRSPRPSYTAAYAELAGQTINSLTALRRAPAAKRAEVARDLQNDPEVQRLLAEEEELERRVHGEAGRPLADAASNAAAVNRRGLSTTDEATDYLRGAARELAHAFDARQREGVVDEDAERRSVEDVTRALSMYVGLVSGTTTVTAADRDWLDRVGVTL